jgi:hypothetical protein
MLKHIDFLRNLFFPYWDALPIDQKGGKYDKTTKRRSSSLFE